MTNCSDSRIRKYQLQESETVKKRGVQNKKNPALIRSRVVGSLTNSLRRYPVQAAGRRRSTSQDCGSVGCGQKKSVQDRGLVTD